MCRRKPALRGLLRRLSALVSTQIGAARAATPHSSALLCGEPLWAGIATTGATGELQQGSANVQCEMISSVALQNVITQCTASQKQQLPAFVSSNSILNFSQGLGCSSQAVEVVWAWQQSLTPSASS